MAGRFDAAAQLVMHNASPYTVEQMAAALRYVSDPSDVTQRLEAYLDADIEFPDSDEEHNAADQAALSIELARRLSG